MSFELVILWTDACIYILAAGLVFLLIKIFRQKPLQMIWRQVLQRPLGMASFMVLSLYVLTALLDSVHFKPNTSAPVAHHAAELTSLLDVLIAPIGTVEEKTYSAPFARQLYNKELVILENGKIEHHYPTLNISGARLKPSEPSKWIYILQRATRATGIALGIWLLISIGSASMWASLKKKSVKNYLLEILRGKTLFPLRLMFSIFGIILLIVMLSIYLGADFHILGTDKIGEDTFYQSLKSIRTGLIIGTLSTVLMLPFAIVFGTIAGYFGGWIDDAIQYLYTTLSAIPGVLLIAAAILSLQIFMTNHPTLFPSVIEQADIRLLMLCAVLGISGWIGLCRILRGETLKLREAEYVQAARVLGLSQAAIITRHIVPNVMHFVLIAVVLDFSGLVLAEAILSYVGVGVDPSLYSWGNMINSARLELAQEPVVWWPLLTAFIFMFSLVLAANLFSDVVRDAFDPRADVY